MGFTLDPYRAGPPSGVSGAVANNGKGWDSLKALTNEGMGRDGGVYDLHDVTLKQAK